MISCLRSRDDLTTNEIQDATSKLSLRLLINMNLHAINDEYAGWLHVTPLQKMKPPDPLSPLRLLRMLSYSIYREARKTQSPLRWRQSAHGAAATPDESKIYGCNHVGLLLPALDRRALDKREHRV